MNSANLARFMGIGILLLTAAMLNGALAAAVSHPYWTTNEKVIAATVALVRSTLLGIFGWWVVTRHRRGRSYAWAFVAPWLAVGFAYGIGLMLLVLTLAAATAGRRAMKEQTSVMGR